MGQVSNALPTWAKLALGVGLPMAAASCAQHTALLRDDDPDNFRTHARVAGMANVAVPALGALLLVIPGVSRLGGTPVTGAWRFGIGVGTGLLVSTTLGNLAARRVDETLRPGLYRSRQELLERTIDETRRWYADHGIDEGTGAIRVVYDRTYDNAQYAAVGDMIRIGRDPRDGASLADSADVVRHEFAHRVILRYAPGLGRGGGEPLTVNESLADTLAVAMDDDWLSGDMPGRPNGFRSLADPSANDVDGIPHPAHRRDLATTNDIHVRAGVPNHAAYRIGNTLGRDAMAEIYLGALREGRITSSTDIADLADAIRDSVDARFGPDSRESRVVAEAWEAVGY